MKSQTLPSFWDNYKLLIEKIIIYAKSNANSIRYFGNNKKED